MKTGRQFVLILYRKILGRSRYRSLDWWTYKLFNRMRKIKPGKYSAARTHLRFELAMRHELERARRIIDYENSLYELSRKLGKGKDKDD